MYSITMGIEEFSRIAASSKAAKFRLDRGGFMAEVISTTKIEHVNFMLQSDFEVLKSFFETVKPKLKEATKSITKNMEKRGGGILDIELRDKTESIEGYFQLHATFETLDAMGANFINSCLEQFAKTFREEALKYEGFSEEETNIEVIMSILSNYVPDCLVRAEVSCPVKDLTENPSINPEEFANKFIQAVRIAEVEPFRAVTHNKGIMNGIDAVVLATGND